MAEQLKLEEQEFSATTPAAAQVADAPRMLRPERPTTPKPTKPDYFPLSVARRPMGPAVYPGAAAAEDASKGLLVSDAMHDMTLYTNVSELLPDTGRPVLNSILFSQRHVVNDGPSIEEEIAALNEQTRLWRASRLQEVITSYEHAKEQTKLDRAMEERIKEREVAERDRALRRISRILDALIPDVDKASAATKASLSEELGPSRRDALLKQCKERDEIRENFVRDMRLAERRWLVERQYQRNVEERNSLDLQHYFSLLEKKKEQRSAFLQLCETFYREKIVVGVIDDEREVRKRVERLEAEARLDVMEQMQKLIPPTDALVVAEATVDAAGVSAPTEKADEPSDAVEDVKVVKEAQGGEQPGDSETKVVEEPQPTGEL